MEAEGIIATVIDRIGATVRSQGAMNKAVVQSVLLYGRNSRVFIGEMINVLTEFYLWAA